MVIRIEVGERARDLEVLTRYVPTAVGSRATENGRWIRKQRCTFALEDLRE